MNSGGGLLPRQRFDNAHTALRVIDKRVALESNLKWRNKKNELILCIILYINESEET